MNKKYLGILVLVCIILIGGVSQTFGQNIKIGEIEGSISDDGKNTISGSLVDQYAGTIPADQKVKTNIAGPVELTFFRRYTNASYVADGIGVRNTGRGTISLRMPRRVSLRDAWLYWMILNSTAGPHDNEITVNGERVVGSLIGTGLSPCWPSAISQTNARSYRANINSVLSDTGASGGDFGITIGGMSTVIKDGRSEFEVGGFSTPAAEYVGAIIVYSNPGTFVQIFNGYSVQEGGTATFTVPAGTNRFSSLIGDGQILGVTAFTKSVAYNAGVPTVLQQVTLNGVDPSITSKATNQGTLADTDTFSISTAGIGATLTWNLAGDCVSYEALVFSNAGLN